MKLKFRKRDEPKTYVKSLERAWDLAHGEYGEYQKKEQERKIQEQLEDDDLYLTVMSQSRDQAVKLTPDRCQTPIYARDLGSKDQPVFVQCRESYMHNGEHEVPYGYEEVDLPPAPAPIYVFNEFVMESPAEVDAALAYLHNKLNNVKLEIKRMIAIQKRLGK